MLPEAGFGAPGALPDWRKIADDESDDDELPDVIPPDFIKLLGFDPLAADD